MNLKKDGVIIIGAGNVASHLAVDLFHAGITINSIVSRNPRHAHELAEKVNANFSADLKNIPLNTELVILCLTDSVVEEIARDIDTSIPIVHTSGSLPLEILGNENKNIGVFYPFQTFSKGVRVGELSYPLCIEASNKKFLNYLTDIAKKLSEKVVYLDSEKRLNLHLSAVVANNFSNHILARVFDFLEEKNIDSDLIHPILEETISKVKAHHPRNVQTGPAIRGNAEIIKKHLDLLSDNKSLHAIYDTLSKSILEYYMIWKDEF